MDEVIQKRSFKSKLNEKFVGLFVIEPISFSSKKQINLRGIAYLSGCFLGLFCLVVFLTPTPELQTRDYSERRDQTREVESDQTASNTNAQNPFGQAALRSPFTGQISSGGSVPNRNTAMVIPRDSDSLTTLPPGTKFWVKLAQNVTVTGRAMPVIGIVDSSVPSSSSIAIPEDSQIFGEAVLDSDSERASITWKSILFPDGRSKTLTALALGADNQAGVEGEYHSDALKNTAGQMVSRFVGGFAQGAISQGPLGATQGGIQNGLLRGTADTARDRTEAWSADLKKEKAWIELQAGTKFQAIISQPFVFRDPGGVN